jgi:YD repeat-containing protein
MKKLIISLLLLFTFICADAKDNTMSTIQYPDYTLCKIKDRKTIAHLDGIWHDVKVEYDENGLVVYRGVHEKKSPDVTDDDWCVWKYTYDTNGRQTRIQGPLHGKFGWEDKTSDAFWYDEATLSPGGPWPSTATGEGDRNIVSLRVQIPQTWEYGYRPKKIRFTFTGKSTLDIIFQDNFNVSLLNNEPLNIISGEIINLTFVDSTQDHDLSNLLFENLTGSFTITKIEFGFVEEEECHGGGHGGRHEHYRNMMLEYDDEDVLELIANFLRALR